MTGKERYSTTYSSTPAHLTGAYLIPPIEEDPHFRDRVGRRSRREAATLRGGSISPTAASEQASRTASAAASERRRAAYAAAAQRQAAAANRRATTGPAPQQTPRSAPAQPDANAWRQQLRSAVDSGDASRIMGTIVPQMQAEAQRLGQSTAPTGQAQGPRPAAQPRPSRPAPGPRPGQARPRPKKRTSILGRIIPIIVVLVLLGTVFRPAISALIDVFTPDGPSSSETDPDAYQPPADAEEVLPTSDIGDLLADAYGGDSAGEVFTAYGVVLGAASHIGDQAYEVRFAGYRPASADDGGYEGETVMVMPDDAEALAQGDTLLSRVVVDEADYSTQVTVLAWERTEPHDLAQDFAFEELARDDIVNSVTYRVTVTNTTDVEMEYTGDIVATSGGSNGTGFAWLDPIAPGATGTVEETVYFDGPIGDSTDPHIENPLRY